MCGRLPGENHSERAGTGIARGKRSGSKEASATLKNVEVRGYAHRERREVEIVDLQELSIGAKAEHALLVGRDNRSAISGSSRRDRTLKH